MLCDHSGRSKQVGFVQFCSDEEAHKAVKEMNGKVSRYSFSAQSFLC